MYKIYKITNKKHPSEIYIGSSKQTLKERFRGHTRDKRRYMYPYIQRDGKENFEIIAIDYANNKKEALEKEEFWTIFYKEQGYFMYNKQAGSMPTQETKQKISKKQKERFKDPTNNPMYGKHHTEEAKIKISKANKGRLAGEKHPFFGKHLSDETKEKISKSRKGKLLNSNHPRARKIRCIDDNKVFDCIKDAAEFYNASISAIINNCKKKSKSCAGHHFEYINIP